MYNIQNSLVFINKYIYEKANKTDLYTIYYSTPNIVSLPDASVTAASFRIGFQRRYMNRHLLPPPTIPFGSPVPPRSKTA